VFTGKAFAVAQVLLELCANKQGATITANAKPLNEWMNL